MTAQIYLVIIPVAFIVFAAIVLVLYIAYRSSPPIKARPFLTSFLCQLCIALWISLELFGLIQEFQTSVDSCYVATAKFMLLLFVVCCYNAQGWVLWFQYKRTIELAGYSLFQDPVSAANTPRTKCSVRSTKLQRWFSLPQNKKYKSELFLWKYLGTLIFFELLSIALVYVFTRHTNDECGLKFTLWAFKGLVLLAAMILCGVIWRTRIVRETFYIRKELLVFCIISVTAVLVRITTEEFDNTIVFYVGYGVVCILGIIGFFNGAVIPVMKTFERKTKEAAVVTKGDQAEIRYSLDAVLLDETLKGYFREHLMEEFSFENLMFLEYVEMFESTCQASEIEHKEALRFVKAKAALTIYYQFITESSTCTVNLRGTVVEGIVVGLQRGLPNFPLIEHEDEEITAELIEKGLKKAQILDIDDHIFKNAKDEIFKLLQSDSFPRFVAKLRSQQISVGAAGLLQDLEMNNYNI